MPATPSILAFAGSLRAQSLNKMLLTQAAAAARKAGAEVTQIDLRDFPLPLYDQDIQDREGIVPNAVKLKEIFKAHQGLLIASPEYNSSISGVLKNAIDWVSRSAHGEAPLACFDGKVAALISASGGALGGLRGLVHLRSILGNIKVLVIPDQLALPQANDAFNPDGSLKDPKRQAALEQVTARLVQLTRQVHAG